MQQHLAQLENRLWDAADELRANSGLKPSEYGTPVLGLIFLRFAETRFEAARERIEVKASARRRIGATDFQAEGILYVPKAARFSHLLALPKRRDRRATPRRAARPA
jgi:type I restriction enzyme M protein